MKSLFLGSSSNPYILIQFDETKNIAYKYQGFEYGEFYELKRKYFKRPGLLVNYLKEHKFDFKKVELNINL